MSANLSKKKTVSSQATEFAAMLESLRTLVTAPSQSPSSLGKAQVLSLRDAFGSVTDSSAEKPRKKAA